MSSISSINRNHQAAQWAATQDFSRRKRHFTIWKPLLALTIAGAVVFGVWMGGSALIRLEQRISSPTTAACSGPVAQAAGIKCSATAGN